MKSDEYKLLKNAENLEPLLNETEKMAKYRNLSSKETERLRLLAEELVEMLPSLLEFSEGKFWIESEAKKFEIHAQLTPNESLTYECREKLLDLSSSKKNSAANGVLHKIRLAVEFMLIDYKQHKDFSEAFYVPGSPSTITFSHSMWSLQSYREEMEKSKNSKWDELEKSIIAKFADDVMVSLKGNQVDIVIKKSFE